MSDEFGMTVLIAVIITAYLASAMWLTLRILIRKEKRPTLMAAVLVSPCFYALSFGPMASLGRHGLIPTWMMAPLGKLYSPIIWFLNDAPGPAPAVLSWLSALWP